MTSRRLRRFEIIEHHHDSSSSPAPYSYEKTITIYKPSPTKTLTMPNPWFPFDDDIELLNFPPALPPLFDDFDTITDLIQIDESPFRTTRRVTRRVGSPAELYLKSLSDRVSDLELGLENLLKEEKSKKKKKEKEKEKVEERKYTWTAEIKNPDKDKKFKWTAEIKDDGEKSYKWTAAIKGKGDTERTYTVEVSSGGSDKKKKCGKDKKEKEKAKAVEPPTARVVEIEEPAAHHGAIVLRKTFAKRVEKKRGKRTEMSPQDAASLIQISFRAYLIRRSQSLRALRELAIAKSKLKEIRTLFNNFTYRRRLSRDAEERQRFSEKLIVLLLTVDAIEGADVIVRAAKKSMVDELEAMLDVVDPQPAGKSLSSRRTFDMPDGAINQELAKGVAQVVRMLDEEGDSETFEASA